MPNSKSRQHSITIPQKSIANDIIGDGKRKRMRVVSINLIDWDLIKVTPDDIFKNLRFQKSQGAPILDGTNSQYLFRDPEAAASPVSPSSSAYIWTPANRASLKLTRCVESMRDLLASMNTSDGTGVSKRQVKAWSTPLYNLVQSVDTLYEEINTNAKRYSVAGGAHAKWFRHHYKLHQNQLKPYLGNASELRIVRDRLHSHIDPAAVEDPELFWKLIDPAIFLKAIAIAIYHYLALSALDGAYGWKLDRGSDDVLSLSTEEFILANFYRNKDGSFETDMWIIVSIKHCLVSQSFALMKSYNRAVESLALPKERLFKIYQGEEQMHSVGMPSW